MSKKIAFFMLSALFFGSAQAENWKLLTQANGADFFIDTSSISGDNTSRNLEVKRNILSGAGSPSSQRLKFRINCETNQLTLILGHAYRGLDFEGGEVPVNFNNMLVPQTVSPNTVGAMYVQSACANNSAAPVQQRVQQAPMQQPQAQPQVQRQAPAPQPQQQAPAFNPVAAAKPACEQMIKPRYTGTQQDKYGNSRGRQIFDFQMLTAWKPGFHNFGKDNYALVYQVTFDTIENGRTTSRDTIKLDCVVNQSGKVLGIEMDPDQYR